MAFATLVLGFPRRYGRYYDGPTTGSYSYLDAAGSTHHVQYATGEGIGFKIEDKIEPMDSGRSDRSFPLAQEVQLIDGLTPEVAAARDEHLETYRTIKALLPNIEEEEEVKIHHLRHEIPATVHRTVVPEIVHSENPPPVLSRHAVEKVFVPEGQPDPTIDGYRPEEAANIEAQNVFRDAIKKLLPMLKEEGELTIPVHHVHHVHHQGHIQAAPPKLTTHHVKITTHPEYHIIEHVSPAPFKTETIHIPRTPAGAQEAADVPLIDGYTPEVYKARQEHLSRVAALQGLIPIPEDETA